MATPKKQKAKIPQPGLQPIYDEINHRHFDGALHKAPILRWNSRLRSAAGRFIPGNRLMKAPVIEVATYLLEEENGLAHILDTLAHEMIHFWLWGMYEPYGHTPLFHEKMRQMGVSRYNPVPRVKPPRFLYRCRSCSKEFKVKRKLGALACLACCKSFANGKFDPRFRLEFSGELDGAESVSISESESVGERAE